ncbi:hypothetical protein MRX96_054777 [Rhipicephalus microplus]
MSSSQSSGLVASGSGMYSGLSQSSGFLSSGSSILARSSQSSGFLASGSLIFLGGQEGPVLLEFALLDHFVVDLDLVRVVGLNDQGVQVAEDVVFAAHLLVDKVVLALVVEDGVHFFGAGTADVRAEHDQVGRFTVHLSLV